MLVYVDTIYADSFFAINLIADYLLLLAAARVSGAVLHRWRIFFAAVLGAAWALASVVPQWGMLTQPAAKIALGVGICLIAYGHERRFWRCCGMFFAISALFGGAVWGTGMLAGIDAYGQAYVPVSFRTLALAFALCYAAVTLFMRRGAVKAPRRTSLLSVTLPSGRVTLRALVDTGNVLSDPISGRPAAVCEASALSKALGPACELEPIGALEALSSLPGLAGRVTLLPYSSVGHSGMLAAIRPERVEVDGEAADMLIALTNQKLDGGYEAVIPAQL